MPERNFHSSYIETFCAVVSIICDIYSALNSVYKRYIGLFLKMTFVEDYNITS